MAARVLLGSLIMVLFSLGSLAQSAGAVFVNANAANNEVWAYTRAANGDLSFAAAYPTQAAGSGSGNLSSENSIILSPNRKFLFVANAASNEISSFRVRANGVLAFVGKVPSGGTFPTSLSAVGNLLYVLNSQGTAHINAFRVSSTGVLAAISGSSRRLSTASPTPAQVGFSPDGKVLVVSEIDTNVIDTYTVGSDGRATGPLVQNSAGSGPFGFAFDAPGQLIVSEVTNSSASSYTVSDAGALNVVTGALEDFGKAACWTINTNNTNFPQQYSYITNTGSNSISGFAIASNGGISLLNSDGVTFQLPDGSFPLDMAISSDSNYLYVVEGKSYGGIASFQINADGSLTQLQDILGLPMSEYGVVGY